MTLTSLLLFVPTCFALNLVPGPNNLLSVHNGACHGFRKAVGAGLGREAAFAILIVLSALGLAALLAASASFFLAVKFVGAAYLLYIAIKLWRAKVGGFDPAIGAHVAHESLVQLMRTEFMVAISNPKAILIFGALLPQFVDHTQPVAEQLLMLGGVFLILEWGSIALYAFMGVYLGGWLKTPRNMGRFNKCCGLFLGTAGLGLLFSRS
ncbi:LysE family translocator [Kerstersia similis]|uniref:LysE family translocator n=1 Tax=Kerstersia similis TaxID=206505 RepID=UPI0039EF1451